MRQWNNVNLYFGAACSVVKNLTIRVSGVTHKQITWLLNIFVAYIRVCVLLLFLVVFSLSEDATTIAWIGSQPLNRKDSSREEVGVAR